MSKTIMQQVVGAMQQPQPKVVQAKPQQPQVQQSKPQPPKPKVVSDDLMAVKKLLDATREDLISKTVKNKRFQEYLDLVTALRVDLYMDDATVNDWFAVRYKLWLRCNGNKKAYYDAYTQILKTNEMLKLKYKTNTELESDIQKFKKYVDSKLKVRVLNDLANKEYEKALKRSKFLNSEIKVQDFLVCRVPIDVTAPKVPLKNCESELHFVEYVSTKKQAELYAKVDKDKLNYLVNHITPHTYNINIDKELLLLLDALMGMSADDFALYIKELKNQKIIKEKKIAEAERKKRDAELKGLAQKAKAEAQTQLKSQTKPQQPKPSTDFDFEFDFRE